MNKEEKEEEAVTRQPRSSPHEPLHLRSLLDSDEDCQFAGRMTVEAFRDVYIHATSAGSLQDIAVTLGQEYRGQDPVFYGRNIVAQLDGENAGLLCIEIGGDPVMVSGDNFSVILGCVDLAGMACLKKTLQTDVPEGHCLIHHICVETKFHRRGIATALIQRAEKEALNHHCHSIYTWLPSSNTAGRRLYQGLQYSVVDSTTRCCCGLWCSTGIWKAVKMAKSLT